MTSREHFAAGTTSFLLMSAATTITPANGVPMWCTAIIASLVSDIDNFRSFASDSIPLIDKLIAPVTKHRGIFHWGTVVLFVALWLIYGYQWMLFFAGGTLSHKLLDDITKILGIRCKSKKGVKAVYAIIWIINAVVAVWIIWPEWCRWGIGEVMRIVEGFG